MSVAATLSNVGWDRNSDLFCRTDQEQIFEIQRSYQRPETRTGPRAACFGAPASVPAGPPASSRPGPCPAAGRQDGGGPRSAPKPSLSSMRAMGINPSGSQSGGLSSAGADASAWCSPPRWTAGCTGPSSVRCPPGQEAERAVATSVLIDVLGIDLTTQARADVRPGNAE